MILKRKYSTDSYTESLQANKRFKHSEGLQASSTELAFVKQAIEGCSGLKVELSFYSRASALQQRAHNNCDRWVQTGWITILRGRTPLEIGIWRQLLIKRWFLSWIETWITNVQLRPLTRCPGSKGDQNRQVIGREIEAGKQQTDQVRSYEVSFLKTTHCHYLQE